ncbi:MAG: hypothetical protein GC181_14275 [Bacteroidetes bacterium]|nr:hypothetical protein [Bacteroidota bacterium]
MQNIKSFVEFQKELPTNPDLQKKYKEDPVKAIQQFQTYVTNNWIYRMVLGSLSTSVLLVIIGIIVLTFAGKTIDTYVTTLFTAFVSGAVGALVGLLAPLPKSYLHY